MNPKVLVLDIETTPIFAYVWGIRDQYVGLDQIKEDWAVMAWCAKWLGDPPSKAIYYDQRKAKNIYDDKPLLLPLWKLLDEAELVITQNGKQFDGPKLNARFIIHGMRPPSPYKHLDTYQIVKHVAQFTSNKLEYLTEKLCTKYKKLHHADFPGMSLWKECLTGNIKAWDAMKKYNIHDVLSTEEFYMKIRAWAPANSPSVYFVGAHELKCRTCGSLHLTRQGTTRTKLCVYRQYQCQACGAWQRGEKLK